MRFEVYFTRKVIRQLNDLNPQTRKRILSDLVVLRDYGFTPRLDIKKLRGYENHYRLRIGKHRILFELIKPNKIIIYAILPREQAYQ